MAWNCTGMKLASGSVDQTARVWHIEPHGHVCFLFFDFPVKSSSNFSIRVLFIFYFSFLGCCKWSNLSLNLLLILVSSSHRFDKCICGDLL